MKISTYYSYDELPLFLNSDLVAKTLGIAPSSAYELMHEKDFPTLYILSPTKYRFWVLLTHTMSIPLLCKTSIAEYTLLRPA